MSINICIFGDSNTYAGYIRESWPNLLRWYLEDKKSPNVCLFNLGINSQTTTELLERFSAECLVRNPSVIVFAIGTNDASFIYETSEHVTEPTVFQENLKRLIEKSKKYTENIVFVGLSLGLDSVEPLKKRERSRAFNKELNTKYNNIIQQIVLEHGCNYIPLSNILTSEDFRDGLHYNEAGHQKVFFAVAKLIEAIVV